MSNLVGHQQLVDCWGQICCANKFIDYVGWVGRSSILVVSSSYSPSDRTKGVFLIYVEYNIFSLV